MIVDSPKAFCEALAALDPSPSAPAVPGAVFMVMPRAFRVDPESSADNPYLDLSSPVDPERARRQAEHLAEAVEACGVPVIRFPGCAETPDAVFPNNAFATAPGRFIVGRMRHAGRRREARRADIRDFFSDRELFDLSTVDCVAELTGPLVIDRARNIGFCGMTERVDEAGLEAMHRAFGLRLTYQFGLVPGEYHTNVVMSVLAGRACILYPGAFSDARTPEAIAVAFTGRTLFIDEDEKNDFAANCIALTETDLFMSERAAASLRPSSSATIASWGFTLHTVPLDELEKAGGSLRCLLAEIF